jgi:hypothetical protein
VLTYRPAGVVVPSDLKKGDLVVGPAKHDSAVRTWRLLQTPLLLPRYQNLCRVEAVDGQHPRYRIVDLNRQVKA